MTTTHDGVLRTEFAYLFIPVSDGNLWEDAFHSFYVGKSGTKRGKHTCGLYLYISIHNMYF